MIDAGNSFEPVDYSTNRKNPAQNNADSSAATMKPKTVSFIGFSSCDLHRATTVRHRAEIGHHFRKSYVIRGRHDLTLAKIQLLPAQKHKDRSTLAGTTSTMINRSPPRGPMDSIPLTSQSSLLPTVVGFIWKDSRPHLMATAHLSALTSIDNPELMEIWLLGYAPHAGD